MNLHIDGSFGEGGGQILRTSLAMAALLQKPVEIHNIRANRKKPGLRPQHLVGVKALARITEAETTGAFENSQELYFAPQTIKGGNYRFDIRTAGATTLVLAAILPPLLFAPQPSTIVISGGTQVPFSPPVHYVADIFLPMLEKMGAKVSVELKKWGWYPKGGGQINVHINPVDRLLPCNFTKRGLLQKLDALVVLANLPDHIREREEKTLTGLLAQNKYHARFRRLSPSCVGQGNLLFLKAAFAETVAGFTSLGQKGKPAEQVAEEAGREFLAFTKSPAGIDLHLADQLIPYMALAHGDSHFITERITSHLLTNIAIVDKFLPVKFSVDEKTNTVTVAGANYSD